MGGQTGGIYGEDRDEIRGARWPTCPAFSMALAKLEVERGHQVAVVVSAMAGETNNVGWTNEAAR